MKSGIKVAVWTVNQKQAARFFIDHGVDWITTDQLSKLQGLLINSSAADAKRYML